MQDALESAAGNEFINPNYGKSIYRRRIRLIAEGNSVIGELEDTMHGFRSCVEHDGECVTTVTGDAIRYPLSSCPGALEPLQELVGVSIQSTAEEINRQGNPFGNCTHLYDLSILAVAQARRLTLNTDLGDYQYDVEVHDETEAGSRATVSLNGERIHDWLTQRFQIVEPGPLAGNTLFQGFSAWAKQHFQGIELEAAHVLQKGYFVAQANRFDTNKLAGKPALIEESRRNVCYSFSDGTVENAIRLGTNARDFTDTPEQLLKFE